MEPKLRYARTSDGVSLAFWTLGSGPALLSSPHGMISDIAAQWRVPQIRRWLELLAGRYTVLQYDYRGFGSSQRDVTDINLDTMMLDIDTVATAAGFDRFAMLGTTINGAIAVAYAARFPERVSHLVLWSAGWGGPTAGRSKAAGPLDEIASTDWSLYARLRTQAQWGWADPEQARAYTRIFRESTNAATYLATVEVWKQIEIDDLLGELRVPTLVVQSVSRAVPNPESSKRLASGIPGARLVSVQNRDYVPWLSEEAAVEGIGIMAEFLESIAPDEARPKLRVAGAPTGETAVILFTDIADSTEITERLGDAAFRDASRALDANIRAAIRQAGGSAVEGKVLGDGVLGVFSSAAQAIAGARGCAQASGDLGLHIGLHAGDVIREEDNVYGGAVNVASRICGLCQPGEILVSATVRELARTSAAVTFEDRGEHVLKGIADPVRVFAVRSGE